MAGRSARSPVLLLAAVLRPAVTTLRLLAQRAAARRLPGLLVVVASALDGASTADPLADTTPVAGGSSTSAASTARTRVGASIAVAIFSVGLVVVLSLVSVGATACRYGN
jgi:hypothetical protein